MKLSLIQLLAVLSLWLVSCQATRTENKDDLTIASDEYVFLTQKALTYQAEFDMKAWGSMLADNVVFIPPEGESVCQNKADVLANWLSWRQQKHLTTLQLSQLTHLPVYSPHQLPLMGKAGVFVVSYCLADLRYTDGHTRRQSLHVCCHFDPQKRIDYYSLYFPADLPADQASDLIQ